MTAMSERELKKIQADLAAAIEEQRKENQFKPSLIEALDAASEIINLERRAEKLTEVIGILEVEELDVPKGVIERAEDFEDDAHILKSQLRKKFDAALEEMKLEHLLKFAQAYFNIEHVPHFNYIVEHLTDSQKEKIYEILHSEEAKDNYDEHLVWRFEKEVGYSLKFAKQNKMFDESDEKLKPFVEYLDKYVKVYTEKVPARIEWLKTMQTLNLSEQLMFKYSDAAVRGLGIASSPDEEVYKPAFEDFKKILEGLMEAKQK